MGVKGLWKLVSIAGKPVSLESLDGKILAIDVSIWLNKAVKGMRDKHGNQVYNAHLVLMFHRICKLLFYGIKPVFVFDGDVPELKKKTQKLRRSNRLKAEVCKRKIQESIISNFLKSKAIECVTGLKSTSNLKLHKSNEPDLFDLPPFQAKKVESSDEEENSWLDAINSEKLKDMFASPELVDTSSTEFINLPPEVKHELLIEMQDFNRKRPKRKHSPDKILPQDSGDFSSFQLTNLIKRGKITHEINSLRKEMNSSLATEYMEQNNTDHNHKNKEIQAKRLISDAKESYILIKSGKSKSENILFNSNIDDVYAQFAMKGEKEEENLKLKNIERVPAQFKKISFYTTSGLLSDDSTDDEWNEVKTSYKYEQEEFELMSNSSVSDAESSQNLEVNICLKDKDLDVNAKGSINIPYLEKPDELEFKKIHLEGKHFVSVASSSESLDAAVATNVKTKSINKSELVTDKEKLEDLSVINHHDTNKSSITGVKVVDTFESNVVDTIDSSSSEILTSDTSIQKNVSNVAVPLERSHVTEITKGSIPSETLLSSMDSGVIQENALNCNTFHSKENQQEDEFTNKTFHSKENQQEDEFTNKTFHSKENQQEDEFTNKTFHLDESLQEGELTSRTFHPDENLQENEHAIRTFYPNENHETCNSLDNEFTNKVQYKTKEELLQLEIELNKEKQELELQTKKKTRQAATLSAEVYNDVQDLLQLFGIPYLVSPMEAEAQCAALDYLKLTNGTITDDSDIFLFGAANVYKNIFNKNKLPENYSAKDLETLLYLTREKLIALAFLTGSDYTEGLPGVGGVTAMEILQAFSEQTEEGTLESFRKWVMSSSSTGGKNKVFDKLKEKLNLDGIPSNFNSKDVWDAYLNPIVDSSEEKFEWSHPDIESIKQFASEKMAWSVSNTLETLKPLMEKWKEKAKLQRTLDTYFTPKIKFESGKEISKRLQNVLKGLGSSTSGKSSTSSNLKRNSSFDEEFNELSSEPSEDNKQNQIDSPIYSKAEIPQRSKKKTQPTGRKKYSLTVSRNEKVQAKKVENIRKAAEERLKPIPPLIKVKDINSFIQRRLGRSGISKK